MSEQAIGCAGWLVGVILLPVLMKANDSMKSVLSLCCNTHKKYMEERQDTLLRHPVTIFPAVSYAKLSSHFHPTYKEYLIELFLLGGYYIIGF